MLVCVNTGEVSCRYEYDALGKCTILWGDAYDSIVEANPFRWKGFYLDSETGFYYANGSYYDPETGLYLDATPISTVFDNADSPRHIDRNGILGYNTLDLAGSPYNVFTTVELSVDTNHDSIENCWESMWNPVIIWWNNINPWVKVGIGLAVIVGLAIATIATGGTTGGVAGYVLIGAFRSSIIGSVAGTISSGLISGISTAIHDGDFLTGFINGAVDGFVSGAIVGGVFGAIRSYNEVVNAAKYWAPGTSKRTSTPIRTLDYHYKKHVVTEGFKKGNNVIKYTHDAISFAERNAAVLKFNVPFNSGLQPNWTFVGKVGMNGQFTSLGKILTFWYKSL